jgi:type IV pilus assembly protein PilP
MSFALLVISLLFNFCFAQMGDGSSKAPVERIYERDENGDIIREKKEIPAIPPTEEGSNGSFSPPPPVPPSVDLKQIPPSIEEPMNDSAPAQNNMQTIELINEGKTENKSMMNEQQSNQNLSWDPTGKRDPFKPYRAPRVLKQNSDVFVDPLTLLDLSQVQVVAILWNNKNPRAVVKSSDGKLYTIFKRTNVGVNNGIVAEIREGEVIVVETFDDGF